MKTKNVKMKKNELKNRSDWGKDWRRGEGGDSGKKGSVKHKNNRNGQGWEREREGERALENERVISLGVTHTKTNAKERKSDQSGPSAFRSIWPSSSFAEAFCDTCRRGTRTLRSSF